MGSAVPLLISIGFTNCVPRYNFSNTCHKARRVQIVSNFADLPSYRCVTGCAGVQLGRLLLQRGDIVLIADSAGVRDIYTADGNAELPTAPLTVLVNKGTASASEVRQYSVYAMLCIVVAGGRSSTGS
jgi:hypothetical protein